MGRLKFTSLEFSAEGLRNTTRILSQYRQFPEKFKSRLSGMLVTDDTNFQNSCVFLTRFVHASLNDTVSVSEHTMLNYSMMN
jgi:hypothetical protein